MAEIADLVFAVTLVDLTALGATIVWSIAVPERRVWPPPGRGSWRFALTWALTGIGLAGYLVLAVLDARALADASALRIALGSALAACGLAFALWGVHTLTAHAALGLGGPLVTGGPYRFSRNPQYVGDIALLLGVAILSDSGRVWLACAGGVLWFALAPFAEEPWLRERLGSPYEDYLRSTPRFLGPPRPPR